MKWRTFFSIIRAHCPTPNLYEYGYTFNKANIELQKRFAVDRPFTLMKKQLSKEKYPNADLIFYMNDITLVSPTEKRAILADIRQKNKGNEQQLQLTQHFIKHQKPETGVLTIRQATQKGNPVLKKGVFYCEHCCKCYRYHEHLNNHTLKKHSNLRTQETQNKNTGNPENQQSQNQGNSESRKRKRGTYNCKRCGRPKRGHICTASSLVL